jgi:hypothetical protein
LIFLDELLEVPQINSQIRAVPLLRVVTSPADRSNRRCFEIAGLLVRKLDAIPPTVRPLPRSSRRISRRVGSAMALNTASDCRRFCVTIWLPIM